jgi:DNA-binding response OmpR family regulator
MRVLVIDDDNDIQEFVRMGLEAESFAVDTAEDGESGSYTARTNDYDVVVLDINLPKKDGRIVCTEIRNAGKKMPIIMLSALDDVQFKIDLLNAGADDYVTKPFSFANSQPAFALFCVGH